MKSFVLIVFALIISCASLYSQNCSPKYTGEGTFYGGAGGGGNCSFPSEGTPEITGAMNQRQYNGSQMCGACVEVTGRKGSITIKIDNRCPECQFGDIDLSEDAFPHIDDKIHGRVPISWKIVPCPVRGPIKFYFKEGSSQWWTAVQIRNHKYPVKKLQYRSNNRWVELPRLMYNYFVAQSGMGQPPYSFRITDINGSVIVERNVRFAQTTEIRGTKQFPNCTNRSTHSFIEPNEPVKAYPVLTDNNLSVTWSTLESQVNKIEVYNLSGSLLETVTVNGSANASVYLTEKHRILLLKMYTSNGVQVKKVLNTK